MAYLLRFSDNVNYGVDAPVQKPTTALDLPDSRFYFTLEERDYFIKEPLEERGEQDFFILGIYKSQGKIWYNKEESFAVRNYNYIKKRLFPVAGYDTLGDRNTYHVSRRSLEEIFNLLKQEEQQNIQEQWNP